MLALNFWLTVVALLAVLGLFQWIHDRNDAKSSDDWKRTNES